MHSFTSTKSDIPGKLHQWGEPQQGQMRARMCHKMLARRNWGLCTWLVMAGLILCDRGSEKDCTALFPNGALFVLSDSKASEYASTGHLEQISV